MARCYSFGELFASRYSLHCHWDNINQNCLEILPSEFASDSSPSGISSSKDTDQSMTDDSTYSSNRVNSDQGVEKIGNPYMHRKPLPTLPRFQSQVLPAPAS